MVINTTNDGRPDLTRHAYKMYVTSDAEPVFLMSNLRISKSTVYDLELRGDLRFLKRASDEHVFHIPAGGSRA